ncbi:GDP-L-fucose synthase family protein [Aerosakkonemataceae cyanobacterium BLCC-F154]|uniref:GDP-L-fucose synthase n=1 Tax=Floridaenema fluviatile BLCC-F154 TaxID=3153640 RepID=A0ABV4YCE2_9CYAN
MEKNAKIYVAGGSTLIGSAILRQLKKQGYTNIVGIPPEEPELTNALAVEKFFAENAPEYVFLAAGKSGGIQANQKYPAELMLDNLLVETHIINNSYRYEVKKLLYLASSCSYPKLCPQPMRPEFLLTGTLEPTNEAYALAKIAGIKLCQAYHQQYGVNFISGIPANSFGIGDDFSLEDSHVIPALILKMHQAKIQQAETVEIWGTGSPRREFIFADDVADGCIFIMAKYHDPTTPINIAGGEDVSIKELAELIKQVVGYQGKLRFDSSKPDGMPLKALDASEITELGWGLQTPFVSALRATYEWFLSLAESGETNSAVELAIASSQSKV